MDGPAGPDDPGGSSGATKPATAHRLPTRRAADALDGAASTQPAAPPPQPGASEDVPVTTPSDAPATSSTTPPPAPMSTSTTARPNGTRISYAAVVQGTSRHTPGSATQPGGSNPPVRMLQGVWRPQDLDKLQATMNKNWSTPLDQTLNPELARLRAVALTATDVHPVALLRPRTDDETAALLAYLRGDMELPHPPSFLKATMPVMQRAIVEQFHEQHVEKTLTAHVPPQVRLRKGMKHIGLMKMLHQANTDERHGIEMLKRIMTDVKLLYFDGIHTLKFVFPSKRVAAFYEGAAFRLQHGIIELEDSEKPREDQMQGSYNPAQLRRLYAVRVYGTREIGLVALTAVLSNLTGVSVLDVERPRGTSDAIVDNRFVQIHFDQESCPEVLRGITHVIVGSSQLTIHHHLLHAREPCKRCYSPQHTIAYCRVGVAKLAELQHNRTRRYTGTLPTFAVGDATTYCHTEADSLEQLLDALSADVQTTLSSSNGELATADLVPLTQPVERTSPTGQSATSSGTVEDGYVVVRRKPAKKTPPRTKETKSETKSPVPSAAHTGEKSPSPARADVDTTRAASAKAGVAGGRAKFTPKGKKGPAASSFTRFQQEWSMGRYTALQDDSDSDSDEVDDRSDDEAPYAYAADGGETGSIDEPMTNHSDAAPQPPAQREPVENVSNESASDSYLGSSPPCSPRSPAPTPGSSAPYSLVSQEKPLSAQEQAPSPSLGLAQQLPASHESIPTPKSEAGYTMGKTVYSTGLPQQLPFFLRQLPAQLITVPANGQCAYSAFFASTTNVMSSMEGLELRFTSSTVREINALKRKVYTLMMANLVDDVQAKLVDPRNELRRIYPNQQPPISMEAATAALFAHYAQERVRSVNSHVPHDFWAGTEVLRAMAQYLREPLYVMDVNEHNDAHVQQYYYKDYLLPNGMEHESGCGRPISDKKALALFEHCANLHVLPTIMVLKQHENHFYGVGHSADVFLRWHAEGDKSFAADIAGDFDWLATINQVPADESDLDVMTMYYEMDPAKLTDAAKVENQRVNAAIIRRIPMRKRLNILFTRLDEPPLDNEPYTDSGLLELMHAAETALYDHHECISGFTAPPVSADRLPQLRHQRFQVSLHGRVESEIYKRLLQSINLEPELPADNVKMRHLVKENYEAVKTWRGAAGHLIEVPAISDARELWTDLLPALFEHPAALHQLFSYLPYPELAVKSFPLKLLLQWGEQEEYWGHVVYLQHIAEDSDFPQTARDFCRDWAAACTQGNDLARRRSLANNAGRWQRLGGLLPGVNLPLRPDWVPSTHWKLLHIFPHALWSWQTTPMGRLHAASKGYFYNHFEGLRALCTQIEKAQDWGAVAQIPTGVTWDERMMVITTGSSRSQY